MYHDMEAAAVIECIMTWRQLL